jgi:hypothetical protein
MDLDTTADLVDDEPEDEAPKRRRPRPVIAQAGEDIPPEINAAFLADLAFERALGLARGLANGISSPSDFAAGGHRTVWLQPEPLRRRRACPGLSLASAFNPQRKGPRMNAFRTIALAVLPPIPTLSARAAPPPRKRTPP